MSRPSRPEPVAAIGECPVPPPLQNLEYRLLDESIQHRRDAQFSDTSPVRLGDFHPSYRLRFVSPVQQFVPGWLASAVSGSPLARRPSSRRRLDYPDWPSPAAMLPSGFLAHILPPLIDSCWLGSRFHSSSPTIQSLPFPPFGLHP